MQSPQEREKATRATNKIRGKGSKQKKKGKRKKKRKQKKFSKFMKKGSKKRRCGPTGKKRWKRTEPNNSNIWRRIHTGKGPSVEMIMNRKGGKQTQ